MAKFFGAEPEPRAGPRCDNTVPVAWGVEELVRRRAELRERYAAGERTPAIIAEGKAITDALARLRADVERTKGDAA